MEILYQISFIATALGAAVIAFNVFFRKAGDRTRFHNFYGLLAFSLVVWATGRYGLLLTSQHDLALGWAHFLYFGSILAHVFFLHVILIFLDIEKRRRNILIIFYINAIFLLILNSIDVLSGSNYFIKDVAPKLHFSFYEQPSALYNLHLINYIFIPLYALIEMLLALRNSAFEKKQQLKLIIFSSFLGFFGGSSIIPLVYDIQIEPFLLVLVPLHLLTLSYAILKYNLFNLKLILVELAILLLNMLLLFNVFTSRGQADMILNIFISSLVFLFSLFLMRGIYKDIRDRERIESLAYEMAVVNEKLKIMEEQKTEFVSIASHQLRTPLTVIKGYASMILERTFGELSVEVQDAMDKLYRSSERIVALVDDLLTVSRLEQGRMPLTFELVELGAFMQSVVDEIEARTTEVGLDISLNIENETEFWSSIDEKKFKQVLNHMLDNAIKYTTSPGSIYLTLSEDLIAQKNRIAISDTGEGMTNEQIRAVFERFNLKVKEPLGDDESSKDGAQESALALEAKVSEEKTENEKDEEMLDKKTPGIGLYIAQEIIHAHKGTLRVESAGKNHGTTFIVELPREAKKDTERR